MVIEVFALNDYDKITVINNSSMARANLNKSENLVTNTTAATKYIP